MKLSNRLNPFLLLIVILLVIGTINPAISAVNDPDLESSGPRISVHETDFDDPGAGVLASGAQYGFLNDGNWSESGQDGPLFNKEITFSSSGHLKND